MLPMKMWNSWEKLPRKRKPEFHSFVSIHIRKYLYVDPPLAKPTKKFHPDDKKEGELLRGFRVKISNIEIINETKEVIDPFLRFIIGGSYFIELKKRGADDTIFIP